MAAARSLLRSSASLLRAAAPARSLGAGASRPSIRRALAAPARPLLRLPVEASFCLDSLLPLHSATAARRAVDSSGCSRCPAATQSSAASRNARTR